MSTNQTFLKTLDQEVSLEFTTLKTYLRERKLEKRIMKVVGESYDEIFEKYIFPYSSKVNDRIKTSVSKVTNDLCITLYSLSPQQQLDLYKQEVTDIDFIGKLHKYSKIGYYEG